MSEPSAKESPAAARSTRRRSGRSPRRPGRELAREKALMRGLEVIGESAIRAGLTQFYGTAAVPQTELFNYLARRLPGMGGAVLEVGDERLAIGMLLGAAAGGARVMTCGTGPGFSRMQEGLSYLCATEMGAVIVHVNRGGPGFGNILPAQSDYRLVTRGCGNGDTRAIVLAPSGLEEAGELTHTAFDLADKYRIPAIVTVDAMIAQMMEPVRLPSRKRNLPEKAWSLTGRANRRPNVLTSVHWNSQALEEHNYRLFQKYKTIVAQETRSESVRCEDAQVVVVAFGIMGRVAKTAIEKARKRDLRIGLFRPVTLWPFPAQELRDATRNAMAVLVVELSTGQMIDDVRRSLGGQVDVHFYGQAGGEVPSPFKVMHEAVKLFR